MLNAIPGHLKDSKITLISFVNGIGQLCCIIHESFVKHLKSSLIHAGYPANSYSGHNFRRASTTFAFKIGIPPSLIKIRGDWHSKCYERYITIPQEMNQSVDRALVLAASVVVV